MPVFDPTAVYAEKGVEGYELGRQLLTRYEQEGKDIIWVDAHHKIPELRGLPDKEYTRLKRLLVLGIRKSLRLVPNERSADFIVPFTSSGCSAFCLYCYLLSTFFTNSYLRVFVNREEIMGAVERKAAKLEGEALFEIGSNSDMVLEDTITGNLQWAVRRFAEIPKARATLATKFSQVDPLLELDHNNKTQIRISVNPADYIARVELGTSALEHRIAAANKLFHAGYRVGINIAPVMVLPDWRQQYEMMFADLSEGLDSGVKEQVFIEIIFMTYGLANQRINEAALPKALDIYNADLMRPKGRGKYCYTGEARREVEEFLQAKIERVFPKGIVSYIC